MFWIIYLLVDSTDHDIIRNTIKNINCFERMRYIVHTGGGYNDLQTDVC